MKQVTIKFELDDSWKGNLSDEEILERLITYSFKGAEAVEVTAKKQDNDVIEENSNLTSRVKNSFLMILDNSHLPQARRDAFMDYLSDKYDLPETLDKFFTEFMVHMDLDVSVVYDEAIHFFTEDELDEIF